MRLTDLFAYTHSLVYHRCTVCFTSRQINAGHILHKGCTCVRCFLPSSPFKLATIVWSTDAVDKKKPFTTALWWQSFVNSSYEIYKRQKACANGLNYVTCHSNGTNLNKLLWFVNSNLYCKSFHNNT